VKLNLHLGFRVGEFEVDPLSGELTGPGGVQHLQPKVVDVLVCLAENAGELVERERILERVWRRPTSEEVLTRCISELRSVLADDRDRPEYIQTVPKRGYRLLKPVTPHADGDGNPAAAPTPSEAVDTPPPAAAALASVAVMPFENHVDDPVRRHFGDAFASELHSTLSRVDRLRIASRRSSFALRDADVDVREIGRRLNVHYVISGSLLYSGSDLRIIAALDDADSGTQVWAESYDRSSDDILAVEREIAEAVVASFTTQSQREEMQRARHAPANSLDAWGLVQRSRSMALEYTTQSLSAAIEPVRHAIELDPDYAAAHATLGSLLIERLINGLSDDAEQDEAAAEAAAAKALTLAPQDPFILKMVGLVWVYCGDFKRSLACLRKAVARAPFDFGAWGYMGWPLTASGSAEDLAELRAIMQRLLRLEPNHPGVPFWLYHRSVGEAASGDYAGAARSIEDALAVHPDFALGWIHYANLLGHLRRRTDARAALERSRAINPAMTVAHFKALIEKMCDASTLVVARTGGLRDPAGTTRRTRGTGAPQ
jgi:TolB-like protein/Tfp pilus assembly protein PilF